LNGRALVVGAADVLDGITEIEAEHPSFDNFDRLVRVVSAAVVLRMIDGFFAQ
jgi:hypothetical protein